MAVNEITGLPGQSRNSFLNRLKEDYVDAWEDHVHKKVVIASKIAQKKGTMGGKRVLTSVMNAYPASAGIALFEGDDLQTPRAGTYFNPELISRTNYTRLRWSGNVERAARKGNKVAWATPRTEDLRTARIQFEINFARQLYLGPHQCVATNLLYTAGTPGTTPGTLTLYGRDTRNSQAANRFNFGSQYIRPNMSLSASATIGGSTRATNVGWGGAIGSQSSERYVLSIDTSTPSAPILNMASDAYPVGDNMPATTPGVGDYLIPYRSRVDAPGADGASTDSNFAGPNGLYNLVATSAIKQYIYGVSRTTYPSLEGFVFNNGSGGTRAWNEDYLALAADRIQEDGTGDDPDTILVHRSIRREYIKETRGDRRFEPVQTKKGYAGDAQLQFQAGDQQLPIITDRDCPPGLAYILETEGFGWFSEADLQMADEGERFVSNKDAHEVVLVKSGNCMTRKPHNNAVVDDISYSTTGLTDIA